VPKVVVVHRFLTAPNDKLLFDFKFLDGVQPRVLVAGGKGVGKSTLVRFLVNRLLDELKGPVVVLDLDPGQAEFTVPGRG